MIFHQCTTRLTEYQWKPRTRRYRSFSRLKGVEHADDCVFLFGPLPFKEGKRLEIGCYGDFLDPSELSMAVQL
jgi:hypothetical protein